MKDNFYNEETLRKFLLEDVSDELRDAIEDRFLEDEDFMAELLVVEDELIEDYLRGSISSREKEFFEKAILANPRRRERVVAMKGVIAAANAEAVSITPQIVKEKSSSLWSSVFSFLRFENSLVRFAFAAIALLIVLGALFLVSRRFNENDRIANIAKPTQTPHKITETPMPSPALSPTPKIESSPQASPTPKLQSSESVLATVILRPTLLRDPNKATKISLESSVKQVRVQLNLEGDEYKSYVVRITTVEGRSVWQGGPLYAHATKSGKAIVINLQAKILPSDDYIVELSGVSEAGPIESFADYFFSIKRK